MKRNNRLVRWTGLAVPSLFFGTALLLLGGANSSVEAQASSPLRVVDSNTSHVVLELQVSSYDTRAFQTGGANYSILSVPGFGETDEAGKPQLPTKGAMVGIPPGAQATLRILTDQSSSSALANPPRPAPTNRVQHDPRQTLPGATSETYTPNASTYSANQFYPADAAKIGSIGNWRSQHFAAVQFYPLQYNPATRQLTFHRRLQIEIAFTYPRGPTAQALGGAVDEGPFESVLQNALVNYSTAKNWRSRSAPVQLPRAPSKAASPSTGTWFKIGVPTDGVYKVTCGDLASQNGGTLSVSNPSTLQLFKQAYTATVEYAINVVGGGGWNGCGSGDTSDYIEFFGQAANTRYTNTNVYWLTFGNTAGKRMATRDGTPGVGAIAASYTQTLHLEQNLIYRSYTPQVENFEHWYWDSLGYCQGCGPKSYPFQPDHPAGPPSTATLQADVIGHMPLNTHHTILGIGACASIDNSVWTGQVERNVTIPFSTACLVAGTNTVTVTEMTDQDTSGNDVIFTNYFNVAYPRTFDAISDTLRFRQPVSNTWQYQINGFTSPSLEAFDISDPSNVVQIVNLHAAGAGPYQLQFADAVTTTARTYFSLTTAQRIAHPGVVKDTPSNLLSSANGADYLVIAASPFVTNAKLQQLKNLRATQFARVQLIDVQDIYDEFNDGVMDPQAIHDFLQYTYANWTPPAPAHVLLVGAGNFDPKGYCIVTANPCTEYQTALGSTLIPPYLRMVDPYAFGETDSDNCLVAFDAPCSMTTHTLPYMNIGRLPADTTSDVNNLVTKILNYENPPQGLWRSTSAFVTDNAFTTDTPCTGDSGGNFYYFSENIVGNPSYYPPSLIGNRIYYNPFPACWTTKPPYATPTAAHDAIISAINSGRLIVNYIGHGAIQAWASEELFSSLPGSSDLPLLTNGSNNKNMTPVMLELTCRTGYFIYPHPDAQSFAKLDVNLSTNGAVASWAAVGDGLVGGHDFLEKGFFNAVMNLNTRQLGPATTAGKAELYNTVVNNSVCSDESCSLIDTIILFGDPASRLPIQFENWYYLPFIEKK